VDRRKSIELSKANLLAGAEIATSKTAMKTSLLSAIDILRDSLLQDNFSTALAQAREILSALQQLTDGHPVTDNGNTAGSQVAPEHVVRLQAQVDSLEVQVQAWIRAAERLRAKYQDKHQ